MVVPTHILFYVVADSAHHFQQIRHQPGVVANPARGQLKYTQLLAVFVC